MRSLQVYFASCTCVVFFEKFFCVSQQFYFGKFSLLTRQAGKYFFDLPFSPMTSVLIRGAFTRKLVYEIFVISKPQDFFERFLGFLREFWGFFDEFLRDF